MTISKKKGNKKWSIKYKKSINCNRPKGFSQKQYCKYGRTRKKMVKTSSLKRRDMLH
jgi:hypothetical protein